MHTRNVFTNVGLVNIKVSAFNDHGQSNEHKRLAWALQSGKRTLAKAVIQANKSCDETVFNLFCVAYYIGKSTII
jgi:hypothetical protein